MWLLLSLVLLLAIIALEMRRFLRNMRTIPGPLPLPLLGNAHIFLGLTPAEACLKIGELAERHGDTFGLFLGPSYSVMLFNPRDVERVLGSSQLLTKSQEYSFLGRWLNEGLLVSNGRKWHRRRKIITPAFHFRILEPYVEIFDRQSLRLVEELALRISRGQERINLGEAIHLCALDAICETAMGVSINAQSNADSEYVQAVKTISMVLHKRMFNILYRFDLTYMLTPLARAEKKALNVLHQFTEKIIVQRREELIREGSSQESSNDDADVGAKRKMAFLDILLQSTVDERPLSNLDIREEVDTFMFEGHDTTSSALMFFFYNIATHPEAQKKCFEEIRSVVGNDKSTPVSYELLNQLHYVDLCVKETLRMYPSVPLLGRKVLEDCEINGKLIPAGTNIGISPLYLGRREELFSEPNIFKPERFDVVTTAEKLNPYAYIPFSAGPRNCIGQKFAMLEIKAIVANVLRHYEVDFVGDSSEPPVLIAELILRTKEPLMFKVRERVY
uniref:Cyp4d1-RB n=1 Tax=Drosophila melanogaster TaxID=7227 RepID=Q8MS75_DROME|nr:cytochrome P450 4d1, isoform B [Drosophila melanogaster]AOQ09570.1 Cyp4d1-RB [synthetic construct]AAF45736.1 cytochrome P450 4d1, isoform B [Drosophila melanogaster]AAM50899.1 LP06368p [Drosophila melanogaster]AKD42953.1 Cyp4d1-RB [Drosophila melanogaster]AKD42963.1 Cyp4d1-RB [Drosophila melanogaster]|eukprot:NP_726797.1 cytochrome P450-4d1, isoform B [Drosophila melanogaster]